METEISKGFGLNDKVYNFPEAEEQNARVTAIPYDELSKDKVIGKLSNAIDFSC